ncbi:hypothetical protein BGZ82_006958, partial [Podila clonocystis]
MSRPHRRMIPLPDAQQLTQGPNAIRLRKKKDRFLFMTYNLLAQALVRRDMFPHASQKALRWKFRKQNLLQEFFDFGADLACLQEVDFWEETYFPALTKAGYETAYYKNASKKHGCAIVWKKSRFEKVDQQTLEYDECGQPTFTTGNIGLMVALKPAKPGNENPDPNADMILPEDAEENGEEDDNTAIPGGILVATEKIREWNEHLNYTVLIGGDFNTTPRDAAYRAMTRSQMPSNQIPDLENWLITEVTRVHEEATKEETSSVSSTPDHNSTPGEDSIDQLTAQTENLDLSNQNGAKNESGTFVATIDRPYRAAPTGIKLPVIKPSSSGTSTPGTNGNSNRTDNSPPPTIMNSKDFAANNDPKIQDLAKKITADTTKTGGGGEKSGAGEDAPVIAPLEAFTPPKALLAAIEALPRCISIYSQYEALTAEHNLNDNIKPQEPEGKAAPVVKKTPEAELAETTATKARTEHTHGEPVYTNYAT